MASAMHMMKKMELSTGMHGPVGLAVDGAVGFGASYMLGRVYHSHGDKWWGKQSPRIAAVVGKLGAVAASLFTGGHPGLLVGGLNAIGQAGINGIGLEMGLRHAREKTGKQAFLAPAGTNLKAIPGATPMTSMGALGKAQRGRGLDWDKIQEIASSR